MHWAASLRSNIGGRVSKTTVFASLCLLVPLLAFLIYPFQQTIIPAWPLRIVDNHGSPVSEINVTEHWQHWLFEKDAHDDLRKPGPDGRVSFPERTMRTSLLNRLLTRVHRRATEGRDAKVEPAASIVVWGSKNHQITVAVYRIGELPQSEIVVHALR
jgi:hypothetical protein